MIGKEFEEVEAEVGKLAYTVSADEDGFVVLECPNLAAAAAAAAAASGKEGVADDDEDGSTAGWRWGGAVNWPLSMRAASHTCPAVCTAIRLPCPAA